MPPTETWRSELATAWNQGKFDKARTLLNAHGYKVPKSGGRGWVLERAFFDASKGKSQFQYARGVLDEAQKRGKYDAWAKFFHMPTMRPSTDIIQTNGADTDRPGRPGGRRQPPADGGSTPPGDATPSFPAAGLPNVSTPAQVRYQQFMPDGLVSPRQLAASMAALQYGGALRDLGRMIRGEKNREKNLPDWVNKTFDPVIAGMEASNTQQQGFNRQNARQYTAEAGAMGDLFGANQGAAANAASAVAAQNAGDLAALSQLQAGDNANSVGAFRRTKATTQADISAEINDRLQELRDRVAQTNSDRRNAYNKYLTDAQFNRQRAISGAVDIAGALNNQNLAAAMAQGQLQQQALDTTAMRDQIGFNRQQNYWNTLMNEAGLENVRAQGTADGKAFVPWNQVAEGDRMQLMDAILAPWMGIDPATGQPMLQGGVKQARARVMQRLAAAGYKVKKNQNIGRWVDAYLASLPARQVADSGAADYWSGVGGALEGLN